MDQSEILEALAAKIKYSKQVMEDFKWNGLPTTIFKRPPINTTALWVLILLPRGQKVARNEARLK